MLFETFTSILNFDFYQLETNCNIALIISMTNFISFCTGKYSPKWIVPAILAYILAISVIYFALLVQKH